MPNIRWHEGGRVSLAANQVPGVNAVSGLHDTFQIRLDQWGGRFARIALNVPGMPPVAVITYAALVAYSYGQAGMYVVASTRASQE